MKKSYENFISQAGLDFAKFDKAWAFCLGNPWENPADAETLEIPEWLGFADELAQLVLEGKKTAAAGEFASYARDNEPLPQVNGKFDIVLDSQGEPVCAIETTKVYVTKFSEVSAEHAYKEGEGDRSLDYWRKIHENFFTIGGAFDPDMEILCEEFQVVGAVK